MYTPLFLTLYNDTMKMKKYIIAGILLSAATTLHAQYVEDGMRFSMQDIGSTARFKGLGNAQTALGGDLSSISGNPAGLGFFNSSDAAISFGYLGNMNEANYYGNSINNQEGYMAINQLGVVLNFPSRRFENQSLESGWLNFNLGIGYSRTNDFRNTIEFQGENNNSSFTDMLSDNYDFIPYDVWGYDGYMVEYSEQEGYYFPTTSESVSNFQNNSDQRSGSQYDAHISFGANYENRLYLGASIGLSGIQFNSDRVFDEVGDMKTKAEMQAVAPGSVFLDPSDPASDYLGQGYELSYSTRQAVTASGFKATLGLIYKPTENVNLGFSATTPTWYSVSEDYSMLFDSWIVDINDDSELFHYASPDNEESVYYDEYNLRTPYKLSAGVSAMFDQGLLSVDVDYIDYTSMRISDDSQATEDIKSTYQQAVNARIGGEYKITPQFAIRAGYGYVGSSMQEIDNSRQTISGGLGYRVNNIYLDLSYQNKNYNWEFTPYQSIVNVPENAALNSTRNDVVLTVGIKF